MAGGVEASHYLAQHLHINVAHALLDSANDIFQVLDEIAPNSIYDAVTTNNNPVVTTTNTSSSGAANSSNSSTIDTLDRIITAALKQSFLKTDDDFLSTSQHPQHGSTATTALVIGRRLYCANVGDSRTLLCR